MMSSKLTDPFLQAPLTTVMPLLGNLESLKELKSFIFARYEKVEASRQGYVSRSEKIPDFVQAEFDMLFEVLDWLKMSPVKENS
jgi:hypothetical protein